MNGYNMMNGMGMYSPTPQQDYLSRMNISVNNFPHYDIIKVKGQNGAEAFQMAPNSKVLLLDENDPLIRPQMLAYRRLLMLLLVIVWLICRIKLMLYSYKTL